MQPRIKDINTGTAMVVTDLHGVGAIYYRLRDRFLDLHESGQADRLIICGDLIHGYGWADDDASLEMILDVMQLQQKFGADTIIMLMGNHEMPHVYSTTLSKGRLEFTPRFEYSLAELDKRPVKSVTRANVLEFLRGLPIYARTTAGVLITHAGATPAVMNETTAEKLAHFSHDMLLQYGNDQLQHYNVDQLRDNSKYQVMVKKYMAVESPDDPYFLNSLRGQIISSNHPEFRFLWDVLFATNEIGRSVHEYDIVAQAFLSAISAISSIPQRFIVAGHIAANNGYALIGSRHLRLASYAHATPAESGKYLLLDCERPVKSLDELVNNLHPTSET